jgi:hypothetical protein
VRQWTRGGLTTVAEVVSKDTLAGYSETETLKLGYRGVSRYA